MKYEHNETFDKTVGEIVRGGYGCHGLENKDCENCPIEKACDDDDDFDNEKTKQAIIEYIAEEVAESFKKYKWRKEIYDWKNVLSEDGIRFYEKYPVDESTAKETADAARVLLEEDEVEMRSAHVDFLKEPMIGNVGQHLTKPKSADAFYIYNADGEKVVTVWREGGDNEICMIVEGEMDIATARVFSKKFSDFMCLVDGVK